MPWYQVPGIDATPAKIATTVAGLGVGDSDGQEGMIRIGAWPNQHEQHLRWDAANGLWAGAEEVRVTQGDSWAMDLSNRSGAQMVDWSYIDAAIPYGKAHALLTVAPNLSLAPFAGGTGVITVDDTASPHSYPFVNTSNLNHYLNIRDNFVAYTGRTATTFTGCTLIEGSGGVIPINEYVTQGYPGGWGFTIDPIIFAGDFWAAGLRLQERMSALMNSAPGEKKLIAAPYWYQYDPGDGTATRTIPPSGGMGVSATLTSLPGTGGVPAGERSFYVTPNEWSDWPLAAPIKRFIIPKIVGKMEAGPVTSGSILDTKLVTRWVGDPTP